MSYVESYWDYYVEDYYGLPRWGWAIIAVFTSLLLLFAIILLLSKIPTSRDDQKKLGDEETGAGMKMPTVSPPRTPSPTPQFPRDKPLPPPVPSETSEIPSMK